MMFSLTELKNINSTQLLLQISPANQERAWHEASQHTLALARYNAYLNRVCLYTFINWLSEWLDVTPQVWPKEDYLPTIWEVVNGTAIQLGQTRLVLIPSETTDLEELCVPQEWVDIPNWAADYYLAVQVDLDGDEDECFLKVCGFITHRQLKNSGRYNLSDRTYILAAEELIADLTVMQVTLGLQMQAEIPSLPTLSEAEAKKLLQQLGDASVYSPRLRLDVPFEKWAALLAEDKWRIELYNRRLGRSITTPTTAPANNSIKWFEQIFEAGWQSLDILLNTEPENLAFRSRKHTSAIKEVREVSVEGIKLIDLGMQLGNKSVALLVGLTRESEQKIGVRVQLHPARGETYLPPDIKLALLSESGSSLQEYKSRSKDNYIQLKRFSCPTEKGFKIQVSANGFSITEDFAISSLVPTSHE